MTNDWLIKLSRLTVSCVIMLAIIAQLNTAQQSFLNFFSYFTVLSNLFVATALLLTELTQIKQSHKDILRGISTLYIVITGLGFVLLLGNRDDELLPWVNVVLHYISPLCMLSDWLITPVKKIVFKETLVGTIFPILYLFYTFIRGAITGWYPYSFLNPNEVGVLGIVGYLSIFALISAGLTWGLFKKVR